MRQELVFEAALPLPEDYFAGIEKTQSARNVIGEAEAKLSELFGEPVKFRAVARAWKDPNAKPRGRKPKGGNPATAAGPEAQAAAGSNGSTATPAATGTAAAATTDTAAQPAAAGAPQTAADVARNQRAR